MIRITNNTLNEIIGDFLRSGLEINIESFKDWIGINLNDRILESVDNRIHKFTA